MFDTEKTACIVATSGRAQTSTPAAGIYFALPAGGRQFELALMNAIAVPEYVGVFTAETGYLLWSGGTCTGTRQAYGHFRREGLKVTLKAKSRPMSRLIAPNSTPNRA
jgi:hypothetical protein